jgi:hypothetical protein
MNKNQKIFDILPPGKNKSETPAAASNIQVPKAKREIKTETIKENKKTVFFSSSKIFLFLLFLLLVFISLSQFVLNKTEVQLWLKTETFNSEEKLTVDTARDSVDVLGGVIPGKFFEEEIVVSQEFNASGKTTDGGKASGKVRIYNNYSETAQGLVANTRLISADGKLFRTTEKVIIPGAVYEKGKLQSRYADVNIAADQPGESYNIGPTTFVIPGFVGTPKYTAFYGKSFEDMKGGFLGEAPQILEEDIEKAGKDLIDKATSEGKDSLKNKTSADFVLPQELISVEIIDSTSSFSAGAKVEKFTYQVKLKLATVGFKKSDLEKFSNELIISKSPAGKEIQEGSLKTTWKENSIDQKNGKLSLTVSLSAKIYTGVDKTKITEALMGKPLSEVQKIISARPEIAKVQIKSWPFWASQVVEDASKIKIELILD